MINIYKIAGNELRHLVVNQGLAGHAERTIKTLLPQVLRESVPPLLEVAERCEREGTAESARDAAQAAMFTGALFAAGVALAAAQAAEFAVGSQ